MNQEKDHIQRLQDKLGYQFKDEELLRKALTHSSAGMDKNYERLEFLGDRVVGLIIADEIFHMFKDENEGDLAKRHAALVQGRMLARIARRINLGAAMQLSDAERAAGGEKNENILADAMESVIGAVFVDEGLLDACRMIIRDLWGDTIRIMREPPQDPKTALQQWAQGRGLPLPTYEMVSRTGPDHAPTFEVKVKVKGYPSWTSPGSSRRKAEKKAAAVLLAHLNEIEEV